MGTGRFGRVAVIGAYLVVAGVGCGGDGGGTASPASDQAPDAAANPEVVPWTAAAQVAQARRGEYRMVVVVSAGVEGGPSRAQPILEEWVTFDLDAGLIDRAIVLGVDPATGRMSDTASREDPTLRFVYTPTTVYMRHPRAEAQCGTPWVELPPDQVAAATGVEIDAGDLGVVEPLEMLRAAADPGPPTETDGRGSLYDITVPATSGLRAASLLSQRPDLAERLADEERTAQVRVPPDGGPVEITLDQTEVLAGLLAASGRDAGGARVSTQWTVTAPLDAVDVQVPTGAATQASCG